MHRDIKPDNILFREVKKEKDDVCIADMGLASFVNKKPILFIKLFCIILATNIYKMWNSRLCCPGDFIVW